MAGRSSDRSMTFSTTGSSQVPLTVKRLAKTRSKICAFSTFSASQIGASGRLVVRRGVMVTTWS